MQLSAIFQSTHGRKSSRFATDFAATLHLGALLRNSLGILAMLLGSHALAQYGTPESLKAELVEGGDLVFAREAKASAADGSLENALFAPERKPDEKLPALVIFHSCNGIGPHIRFWAEEALKERFVVLVPDGLRGQGQDCGSPPRMPNARLIKDALDGVAHLAGLPYVDPSRISILGFSKGAFVATWIASSKVSAALRPGTPAIASAVSVYGFCGLKPSRGRPDGVRILQPDTDRPLLMLLGGQDTETPPDSCLEQLPGMKQAGAPVNWHIYPDATHSWDAKEKDGYSKTAFSGKRVSYRYDAAVTADTRQKVFGFLTATGKR